MLSTVQGEASTLSKIELFVESTLPIMLNRLITFDSKSIAVGLYRIVAREHEYAVMLGRRRLQVFQQRSWAVTYAYALSTAQLPQAEEIVKMHERFFRLDADRRVFEHHLEINAQEGDANKAAVYQHRLSRCLYELESAKYNFDLLTQRLGIG